jgi:UDP-glucuronate decarboxylase
MDPITDEDSAKNLQYGKSLEKFSSVVVTGSNGMLGSYAVEASCEVIRLLGLPLSVFALSRKPSEYLMRLSAYYGGLLQLRTWDELGKTILGQSNPLIIHAASPASPERYASDTLGLISTNLDSTLVISRALAETGGHCVFLSSGEVYGQSPPLPTSESSYSPLDHLADRGLYGEMKRAAETILKHHSECHRFSASCLRIYHTFGPGIDLSQSRIFSTVIAALLKSEPIVLRSAGQAMRSFLYASDYYSAVLTVIRHQGFQVLNLAGESEISILDFAKMAANQSRGVSPVVVGSANAAQSGSLPPESPILRGHADTSRLRSMGWRPMISTNEAIARTTKSCMWRSVNVTQATSL